jgi:hypothetical protein
MVHTDPSTHDEKMIDPHVPPLRRATFNKSSRQLRPFGERCRNISYAGYGERSGRTKQGVIPE